jgi:hypothetical protein
VTRNEETLLQAAAGGGRLAWTKNSPSHALIGYDGDQVRMYVPFELPPMTRNVITRASFLRLHFLINNISHVNREAVHETTAL